MTRSGLVLASGLAALLASCGGQPSSVDEVNAKLKEELAKDGTDVLWVNAVPQEEPGKFRAFIDRRETGKSETEETLMCNVSSTSTSSSRTCQSIEPSVINRAKAGLLDNYKGRKLDVRRLDLARNGNGNRFDGEIVIADPGSGKEVEIPCRGDQVEDTFTVDCKTEWAAEEQAKAKTAGS